MLKSAREIPPTLSVVVPCFNREASVTAAVQSVLDQDWPGAQDPTRFQVIAVDDGSSDGTLDVLRSLDDPRLRVIENPGPKGACGARNAGAAATDSTWIAFQDSDDVWHPGKLSAQMAAVDAWPGEPVAVYCGMTIRGPASTEEPGGPVLGQVPDRAARGPLSGEILPALVWTSLISTQTLILRRDAFEAADGFDPEMPALQDWDLMLRVAGQGEVVFTDADLVDQYMSVNSITRSSAKRVTAQEKLLANHAVLWRSFPEAAAHHYYRIAGGHRQLGHYRAAHKAARQAAALMPYNLRYQGMAAYLALRGLLKSQPEPGAGHV